VTEATLTKFYGAIDDGRLEEALALLHEKVGFVIVLPAGARRGQGREDMRGHLSGAACPTGSTRSCPSPEDNDVEFVYGAVTEGPVTTGRFLAGRAARCGLPDHQLPGVLRPRTRSSGGLMTRRPSLARWFALMVADAPGRGLELISDDFTMSVQFSKGAGAAAEFTGDHAGLVAYLEQREQSVLVHHVTHGSRVGNVELVLGQTTRNSSFEASFNASALLDADPTDAGVPSSVAPLKWSSPHA